MIVKKNYQLVKKNSPNHPSPGPSRRSFGDPFWSDTADIMHLSMSCPTYPSAGKGSGFVRI